VINDFGWRFTYSALGIVMVIVAVPLHLLVLDRVTSLRPFGRSFGS
jgi:hypothetical protein